MSKKSSRLKKKGENSETKGPDRLFPLCRRGRTRCRSSTGGRQTQRNRLPLQNREICSEEVSLLTFAKESQGIFKWESSWRGVRRKQVTVALGFPGVWNLQVTISAQFPPVIWADFPFEPSRRAAKGPSSRLFELNRFAPYDPNQTKRHALWWRFIFLTAAHTGVPSVTSRRLRSSHKSITPSLFST